MKSEASALRAFATFALLEGVEANFFVPVGESAKSMYLASMRSMRVFQAFSAYIVEGRGCAVATAKQYGRVVRSTLALTFHASVQYGYDWKPLDVFHATLLKLYPEKKRVREPILVEDLSLIRARLDMDKHTWRMYWALLTVTFFGVSRKGDHVPETKASFSTKRHSTWGDLRLRAGGMSIRMEEHKTSHAGGGFDEKPFVAAAEGRSALCPVRAMRAYAEKSQLPWSKGDPLFRHSTGEPLTGPQMLGFIKKVMGKIGRDPAHYGTHSARIGGATLALNCQSGGEFAVKALGFWMGDSALLYTRPTKGHMAKLMKEMLEKDATG